MDYSRADEREKSSRWKTFDNVKTLQGPLEVVSEEPGCCGRGSDVSLKLNLQARHQLSGARHPSDGVGVKVNGTERPFLC